MSRIQPGRWALAPLTAVVVLATACGSAASPASPPLPTTSPSSLALPSGFPLGSWTTTITADDLRAVDRATLADIGMSEADLVKENAGTFTTTFAADGTWTTVQESDQAPRWPVFRGTFVPVGTDAMTQTTTFPPEFKGDVLTYGWRIEDGLLYLTVPDPQDPILPVVMEAHPWSPAP